VFATVPELSAFVGEAIAYRKGLVVTDNCGGEVEVQVDSTAVDPNTPGDYPVSFTATDASGNTAWATTTIHIYENQITEEQLSEKIDGVIAQIITPGMSKEEQLRAVYTYVYDHIAYTSDSDKSDWIRAAYDALFVTGSGDCYNYFSAAIAFCRRLGIDYREIERTPGAADGTHFWIMVNIGDDEKPRWYHFDCTHLRATYSHSGCLLTDAQLRAFNKFRAGFYAYDAASYPASEKIIITPTPDLEKYY
jgi:transglutaminase-like putative cysteine protease